MGNTAERLPGHGGVAYRRDIDGLRAIAVGLVVLYHAGLPPFGSGFVGVDVFFVISGYLITRVIDADLVRRTFRFREFYRRRIKRLLPAWLVVAVATIVAALILSLPDHLDDVTQGIAASAGYVSNIWFWRESGYFAGASNVKPFLHTWSLSVEEQFYFLFPALLVLVRRRGGDRLLLAFFSVIFIVSLLAAQLLLFRDSAAAFYLLPSRAWELLAGSLLALTGNRFRPPAGSWATIVGLALVLGSAVLLRHGAAFPGVAAVPVVVGSALLLWSGGNNAVARLLLENPVAVFLGRISYSLYLWHWPIFAFYHYRAFGPPTPIVSGTFIALAIACAYGSYRWVERPMLDRQRLPGWRSFGFALVASGSIVSVCVGINLAHGLPERFPATMRVLLTRPPLKPSAELCRSFGGGVGIRCRLGATSRPTVVLWGDSHARALATELGAQLAARGQALQLLTHVGCQPVLYFERVEASPKGWCMEFNDHAIRTIMADPALHTVVLAARWSGGLKGASVAEELPSTVEVRSHPGLSDQPLAAAYLQRLTLTIRRLRAAGKRVLVLGPTPELSVDAVQAFPLLLLTGGDPDRFAVSRAEYRARNAEVLALLRTHAHRGEITLVDPRPALCDERRCYYRRGSTLLYADDHHLSPAGARLVAPLLRDALGGRGRGNASN